MKVLMVGDKVLTKDGKVWLITDKEKYIPIEVADLKEEDIVKIERPHYITMFEREETLDEKEKEYLSGVIRPFKDRVKYIEKSIDLCDEYIYIRLDDDSMQLPNFEKDTMYKEMELGKEYTLEELGLDN